MNIRPAVASDVAALFSIRTSVRQNHMSIEELAELGITHGSLPDMLVGTGRGWLAEDGNYPVAFAMADVEDATIFALFVRAEYEGKGIGRLLMVQAEQWLASQGCKEIWLETDADHRVRANGFYRHLGWQEAGMQDDGQVRFIKSITLG